MFERFRNHLTYSNVMVTLLAFVVLGGGGIAIGGVVDNQGRIKACYVKSGENRGDVRLLVKGKCRRSEKRITWNQRGPRGEQGPRGARGEQGPRGARGAQGPPGSATGPASLADNSVTSAKVLDGSISRADLAAASVGASELLEVARREGTGTVPAGTTGNNIWNHATATASCLPGEQLIAGNAAWDNETGGAPMAVVEIASDFSTNSVTVKGATDVNADRTLRAIAICLPS